MRPDDFWSHSSSHSSSHSNKEEHPPRHPPWQNWEPHRKFSNWPRHLHRKRQFLFFRMASVFGFMVLLIVGGMAAMAFTITRLFGGDGKTAILVWIGGCGLSLSLPILAVGLAMRTFRGITNPIADIMAATDRVANGDLDVQVPEYGRGEFKQLTRSFNNMIQELKQADQQRRNLTADVAHELRTPLHIIQGNLEGVLDGVYDPTPEHITATLDETRLLARLVEDLRTLSLAEGGQLPLKLEQVDVNELLMDIQISFSGQAEVKGINLEVLPSSTSSALIITADIGRLNQVLSNLLVNALRHTPNGGSITLKATLNPKTVCITVQDTGEGISSENLPYIFNRFWRGDRARSHTSGAGGGLGLAIAKQLVQAHKGTIEVESELGVGTTFIIELPIQ